MSLYGVNNIDRIRNQGYDCVYIFISILFLVMLLFGCSTKTQSILVYQDNNRLIATDQNETEEYFNDVIDYTYDDSSRLLFVLHSERSNNVDNIGYVAAGEEGLLVGGYIRVYQMPDTITEQPIQLYENDFTVVNPWSIDVGDFEQDGIKELFIGCYRATEFYEASKRPFVISWDGEKFFKKWTGSYIGFDSFIKGEIKDSNLDGYDELVLYVQNEAGKVEERAYKWGNFTFDRLE